ncbi:MAG: hypothetical protein EOO74_06270 [Myxococcales bacterium]|nr:MAG: hypothetical protein EOO74_06270 [Myxococcales bacterium]
MQFTERELTLGVQGAAKAVLAAQRTGQEWESLTPYERYLMLEPVSTQILPVLANLPEVEVDPGTRPAFTVAQLTAAVEESFPSEGRWLKRKATAASRVALVKLALESMPPREDPDNFVVPDHL